MSAFTRIASRWDIFPLPASEAVRFRAHASTVFPASEIQSLRDADGERADMEVNFMGLFGPLGVLPLYYTELIAERARLRDTALIDFLDIFNHRMISLFYRAWEKYRFPIAYERGDLDQVGRRLLDFIGLGTPGLQNRQKVADNALMFYSGLLSQQPRCAANLENLLADYFEVPVEVEQFVGAWYKLDESTQFCMDDGTGRLRAARLRRRGRRRGLGYAGARADPHRPAADSALSGLLAQRRGVRSVARDRGILRGRRD